MTMTNLINVAAALLDRTSEPEDNPEYLRALVDLTRDALGLPYEGTDLIRDEILRRARGN